MAQGAGGARVGRRLSERIFGRKEPRVRECRGCLDEPPQEAEKHGVGGVQVGPQL
jgi:hypothetical protein